MENFNIKDKKIYAIDSFKSQSHEKILNGNSGKESEKKQKLVDWIKQQEQEPKQQQYISIDVLFVYDGLWNIFHMKTFSMQFIIDVCVHPIVCICVEVSTWLDSNALPYTHGI